MTDTRNKYVPPAISETAFNCPHCGALAKQFWFTTFVKRKDKDETPFVVNEESLQERLAEFDGDEIKKRAEIWLKKMARGRPYFLGQGESTHHQVANLAISSCYNCEEIAIWIYDRLVWPLAGTAPSPNPDMPEEVRTDYEEASAILDPSPRGAAALLRLGIQKLCRHLGEPGKNINDDIAALVKKGLDTRVQQALDVVRVIGNNAVHPGQIDLKDDRATAENLFGLLNLITEIMITQPKHVASMFGSLPESARKAIEKRDGKT